MLRPSPVDLAQPALDALLLEAKTLAQTDPDLTETDTRVKLIDDMFKNVLGWTEADIRREVPTEVGPADYVFGSDFKYFHIEAKKINPPFRLIVPSKERHLKLSGSHLLGNRQMKPLIEQAAKYSPELGTEFALLSNGTQYVLFQSTPRGKMWRDGYAAIWHGLDDIKANFDEFFHFFSRGSVEAGILTEMFTGIGSITATVYVPLQFVHNQNVEYIRNRFWSNISQAFYPLLNPQPDDVELQDEIVRNCYVPTRLAEESTTMLGMLLQDHMPKFVEAAGGVDLPVNDRGRAGFGVKVVADLKMLKPGTYILTGGVGSGKTSFLRRFARVDKNTYISKFCVWLHIDFLPIGNILAIDTNAEIERYTYKTILRLLQSEYPSFIPKDGAEIRKVFADELNNAKQTILYEMDDSSSEYRSQENRIVDDLSSDPAKYLNAVLRSIKASGKSLVFVLDNTDQQGEVFQKSVFLFSQKLSDSYNSLTIVSLREDKFFAAFNQGVFNAYGNRKFHIGTPELMDVIRKRLRWGITRYELLAKDAGIVDAEREDNIKVIEALIYASTEKNSNIMRFLASVSSGDMRLALSMFSDFMSSGNTNVSKIQRILARGEVYSMPFHEFAKSAILGSRRYYKASSSRIVNLFAHSTAAGASHWTDCRILARLSSIAHTHSAHGEGYLETTQMIREHRESFGNAEDFIASCEQLLARGLIESEPPRAVKLKDSDALHISATGEYYWSYLVRSFAYLDLIFVDTPIADESLARELAVSAEEHKENYDTDEFIEIRLKRVSKFLQYLSNQDIEEISGSAKQGGPYIECLSEVINEQVVKEMEGIRERVARWGAGHG